MTFTDEKYQLPKFIRIHGDKKKIPLIIRGQGVFIFNTTRAEGLALFTVVNGDGKSGLSILFGPEGVAVFKLDKVEQLVDPTNKKGLSSADGAYYWFSIDYQNQALLAGVGEARLETAVYNYQFDKTPENRAFLESLTTIDIQIVDSTIKPLRMVRDPVTYALPMLVKDTNKLKMHHIARAKFMPKALLGQTAQKLYECVAGKNFVLNDSSFSSFSKAIEYSIATPGCWCYETLLKKIGEFGAIKETYLRITMGQNNGESPGVPFVMEIWPPGHYSPVHNHGGANAIIKVLHGKIRANQYPFLSKDVERFGYKDLVKDDVTWISSNLNQVHKLENISSKTCVTVQCYMYDRTDMSHYDYFDYLDESGLEKQFEPDSDMDFITFKQTVKKEWENRPRFNSFFYWE
jgi:hypothetical protein